MTYFLLLTYLKFQSKGSASLTELSRRFQNTLRDRFKLLEVLSLSRKALSTLQNGFISIPLSLFSG
jgi:hypothetical protein